MPELEELEAKIFGDIRAQRLRPTLIGLFDLSGVDRADFRLWCQLKADALLAEKLPTTELPWALKPFRSQLEPWFRQEAMDSIGSFIDQYFAGEKPE